MAYPTKYTRQYDYVSYQNANPARPLPAGQIHADYNAIASSLAGTIDFLKKSLRSDGAIMNGAVGVDQLDPDLLTAGLTPADAWASGVAYAVQNSVVANGSLYRCLVAHTSGVFATDLAAGKWVLVTPLQAGTDGTNGTNGTNGAGYGGTSTTSLAIGTGAKLFTTQAGLAYQNGARVRATSNGDTTKWMEGVATYSGTTLAITVDSTNGSGTFADWNFNIAGEVGTVAGAVLAANNGSDFADPAATFVNLGGMDLSTVVNLTAASTLTSAAFGKLHFITGTSANYTTTLPSPVSNAGKMIGFLVGNPASSTKLYTIATPAGNIGRSGSSIVMWANESVLLRSNGADWEVLQSKQIPFVGRLTKTTNQSITSGATFQNVTFDSASGDPAGLNLAFAGGVFTAPRKSVYDFTSYVYMTQSGSPTYNQSQFGFSLNAVAQLGPFSSATLLNFGQAQINAGATATITVRGDGTSPTVAGATLPSTISFTEVVPSW